MKFFFMNSIFVIVVVFLYNKSQVIQTDPRMGMTSNQKWDVSWHLLKTTKCYPPNQNRLPYIRILIECELKILKQKRNTTCFVNLHFLFQPHTQTMWGSWLVDCICSKTRNQIHLDWCDTTNSSAKINSINLLERNWWADYHFVGGYKLASLHVSPYCRWVEKLSISFRLPHVCRCVWHNI